MASFLDIKNAPENLKSFLITFFGMPFWYVCIYIYFPEMYATKDYIIIFCVCFCLNFICTFIVSTGFIHVGRESNVFDIRVATAGTVFHSLLLSIWIIVTYSWSLVFHKIFYFFPFVLIFISLLIAIEVISIARKLKKEPNKQ